jgi:hypothetical protein
MKKRLISITTISILSLYVGSYCFLHANASPAANLMYFVYLKGGTEVDGWEGFLYHFYYPVYKAHNLFGGSKHNSDRPTPVDAE